MQENPLVQRKWVVENPLCLSHTASSNWSPTLQTLENLNITFMTSKNQRLGSAGDSDRRSKCFCCNAVLCVSFMWQMVKTRVIRLRGVEGQSTHDEIALCAFHSFLVEVHSKAGYIHLRRMHSNNLEIRIWGSSCHPESKLACERAHFCELGENLAAELPSQNEKIFPALPQVSLLAG